MSGFKFLFSGFEGIPQSVKICVSISVVCGLSLIGLKNMMGIIIGIIGLIGVFLLPNLITEEDVKFSSGAYIAMLGLAVSIVVNYMAIAENKKKTP